MNNLKAERTLTAEDRVSDERLSGLAQACHIRQINMTADTVVISMTDHLDIVAALTELQSLRSQALSTQQPMGEVRVKPLEWEAVTDQIPKHAYAAYTPFSRLLIVCEFLSMNHMVYRFDGVDFETLDEAKSAAQNYYNSRILSALHPNQESGE